MWPRAEAHGNMKLTKKAERSLTPLQCGRGPKPTEIARVTLTADFRYRLQCGRGPKPTEIPTHHHPPMAYLCFNVAAGRSPRKFINAPKKSPHGLKLQCGRGPKPAEMVLRAVTATGMESLQCGRGPKPTEILHGR